MFKKRYMALVEYNGSAYSGWQRQPFLASTIQEKIEESLSKVAAHDISVICAGRTDAGVHAVGQIFHFDTMAQRDDYAWLAGTNNYLPSNIRLQTVYPVRKDFHARYNAIKRHYRYIILNNKQPSAIWHQRCHWHPHHLDTENMQQAANYLLGEHDFSAFRAAECQSRSPNRFIEKILVSRKNTWIYIDVIGNAFLHHMVRNIVGSLLMVGDGRKTVNWLREVLATKDRRRAGPTAPAFGLYFYRVYYSNADNISNSITSTLPL